MPSRTLELIALGKDQASDVLGNVSGAVSGLGAVASTVATGGLALVAAGMAAIVGGAALAAKAVWDFSADTNAAMKLFEAQTGLAGDELAEMKEIAKDVWAVGFGENIEEVVEQMSLVHRALGLTGDELEEATKHAMTLSRTFEYDVAESTRWASSMMRNFGISSGEAFDILTTGAQMGLDVADDLGDTLNEYSSDFSRLGIEADAMLSILNAGLEAGAYNTDVIADGFREFGIRMMEGGDAVSEAITSMGLDFEAMQASVAAGDETWGDYMGNIIQGLMDIDSEVERNAAGVEIFGTKWEDLGGDVFMAAGMAMEGVEGLTGATDRAAEALDEGFGPALERLKRHAIEHLSPLGDYAGEMLNKMTPFLEDTVEWLGEKIPKAIEILEELWSEWWPEAEKAITDFWTAVEPAFVWLKGVFSGFTSTALPELSEAWFDLAEGLGDVAVVWNDELLPAFEGMMESLGLTTPEANELGEAIGIIYGAFSRMKADRLISSMESAVRLLAGGFNLARDAVGWLHTKMEGFERTMISVREHIQRVKDWIDNLRDALGRVSLPDWLTPGSPTPFEVGLRGIASALKDIPDFPQGGFVGGGASTGAGGTMVNITFGNVSVRSDRDVMLIADQISKALHVRGVQVAL